MKHYIVPQSWIDFWERQGRDTSQLEPERLIDVKLLEQLRKTNEAIAEEWRRAGRYCENDWGSRRKNSMRAWSESAA